MKVRCKSLWRSRNAKLYRKRANQRAAKERKRMERAGREEPMPDVSGTWVPAPKPSGFRVTITCLDDGERVTFKTARGYLGLTISPTRAGRMVAAVLANYRPLPAG